MQSKYDVVHVLLPPKDVNIVSTNSQKICNLLKNNELICEETTLETKLLQMLLILRV